MSTRSLEPWVNVAWRRQWSALVKHQPSEGAKSLSPARPNQAG